MGQYFEVFFDKDQNSWIAQTLDGRCGSYCVDLLTDHNKEAGAFLAVADLLGYASEEICHRLNLEEY